MLKLTYRAINTLKPYSNNSRTHSEKQVKQISDSIEEFGFTNPILIDENNSIIAGHGRLEAAKELDIPEVPTITLENLTEAQRKAYVIADNKLALNAGWDEEKLQLSLDELINLDFDVTLLGWDELPEFIESPDYGALDLEDSEAQLDRFADDVKKAIQIEFDTEHYEPAKEVVKYWRDRGGYVGLMILDYLLAEKEKNETA